MVDGYLMPQYRLLNPQHALLYLLYFGTLFLQESTVMGARGSAIWIVAFGISANGSLEISQKLINSGW